MNSAGQTTAGQTTAEIRLEKLSPPAHDNYVNFDVAQSVLESMARRRNSSEGQCCMCQSTTSVEGVCEWSCSAMGKGSGYESGDSSVVFLHLVNSYCFITGEQSQARSSLTMDDDNRSAAAKRASLTLEQEEREEQCPEEVCVCVWCGCVCGVGVYVVCVGVWVWVWVCEIICRSCVDHALTGFVACN